MVFDGHSDIFSDVTIRHLKGETNILTTHHLDRLKKGEIEGGIFVIWADTPYDNMPRQRNLQTLEAIQKEMWHTKDFTIVTSYDEIVKAKADGKFYIIIGIEGLAGIGNNPELIDYYHSFGARHAMLTWNEENDLATGAQGNPDRGLTDAGREVIRRMEQKNMIVDVSHLNEKSFWDVISIASKPLIASHSNARALCDAKRNLTDDQLIAIRDLDGLVGLNSYSFFVGTEPQDRNLETFVNHLVYISEKIGPQYVGFGFDFFEFLSVSDFLPVGEFQSGNPSVTESVVGMEDCSYVPALIRLLETKGFSKAEMEGFQYQNWFRMIKNILG